MTENVARRVVSNTYKKYLYDMFSCAVLDSPNLMCYDVNVPEEI